MNLSMLCEVCDTKLWATECACCARETCMSCTTPCEGCDMPVCTKCSDEWRMLNAPNHCPDCADGFVAPSRAVIVWPEDSELAEWASDRLAKAYARP